MAMTKKEQAAMQAAIDKAETLAALRWTGPVDRDVLVPERGYSEGWDHNAHSMRIWRGWSGQVVHGQGPAPKDGDRHYNGSQGSRRMFSTPEKALAAMRHEMEQKFAHDLMRVDRQIANFAQAGKDAAQ